MNSFSQDLRHVLQGILITWAILGAIATWAGAGYLLLMVILVQRGELFKALIIPGVEFLLIGAAVVQVLFWLILPRLRLISRMSGIRMAKLMAGVCLFLMISSLFIPR